MPDILDENGIQVKTLNELIAEKTQAMKDIFGENIVTEANSPDGQLINISAQAGVDMRERIIDVYNSFDPDKCIGTIQDSRYKINGISRKGGTYTVQPIDITVSRTVKLQGLDENYNNPNATAFGVKDSGGNVWYLIDTTTVTDDVQFTRLPFRSASIGSATPTVGTITEQVAPIAGVVSVINSVAPTSIGEDQEEDLDFQIRRNKSVAVLGQGNVDVIYGMILQLQGVNDARVYGYNWEKFPDVDENGISPHFIWAIVEGGSNTEIAQVLYSNSGGSGMKGEVEVTLPTSNGNTFLAKFDRPKAVPLYIRFSIQETEAKTIFDYDSIKEYIAKNLKYSIGSYADTATPTNIASSALSQYSSSGTVVNLEISTNGSNYVSYIPCPDVQSQFVVDTSRININEINV